MSLQSYQYSVDATTPTKIGNASTGADRELSFTVPAGFSLYIGREGVTTGTGYRMDGPGGTDTTARQHGPFRIPQGCAVWAVSSAATTVSVLEATFD